MCMACRYAAEGGLLHFTGEMKPWSTYMHPMHAYKCASSCVWHMCIACTGEMKPWSTYTLGLRRSRYSRTGVRPCQFLTSLCARRSQSHSLNECIPIAG